MYLKKESRAKLGKKMDDYMRENIQNEEIFWSVWASMGMPDGAPLRRFRRRPAGSI